MSGMVVAPGSGLVQFEIQRYADGVVDGHLPCVVWVDSVTPTRPAPVGIACGCSGPFYAIRIDLGDLGSKGGLKADPNARVMCPDGSTIGGLYAVGNSAGAPFGDCYPGAGGTLGPATVFGFVAANDIAREARRNEAGEGAARSVEPA